MYIDATFSAGHLHFEMSLFLVGAELSKSLNAQFGGCCL